MSKDLKINVSLIFMKRERRIRLGKSVKEILYYDKRKLKEKDKEDLKYLLGQIIEEDRIDTNMLKEIDGILKKYSYSVKTLIFPDSVIITFYESKRNLIKKLFSLS
jgi:hypothetical protein